MAKLLIVDDELTAVAFLLVAFEELSAHYETRSAMSYAEALALADRFQPDILLTDWNLRSNKDGLDLAKALRERYPDLDVIFITALKDELLQRLDGFPVRDVLEKPVDIERVLSVVHAARARKAA